jgi:hypothetical protein
LGARDAGSQNVSGAVQGGEVKTQSLVLVLPIKEMIPLPVVFTRGKSLNVAAGMVIKVATAGPKEVYSYSSGIQLHTEMYMRTTI